MFKGLAVSAALLLLLSSASLAQQVVQMQGFGMGQNNGAMLVGDGAAANINASNVAVDQLAIDVGCHSAGYQSTVGSIYLDVVVIPMTAAMSLSVPRFEPYPVGLAGYDPPVFVGISASLTYVIEDPGIEAGDVDAFWYVNGALVGTENTYTVQTTEPMVARLDLLVLGSGWSSGGSVTGSIAVIWGI